MKTFKNYIIEARMTSVEEITAAISKHKNAGEILNPEYQDLGVQARRIFGKNADWVREMILKHFGAGDKTEELHNLYYGWPHDSFASLKKAAKLLSKVKDPKHKDIIAAGNQVIKVWVPVAEDLKTLKGMVVKVSQKRAEAKASAEISMQQKFADSSSLIKIFESHMKEYIDMARKRAEEFVEAKLEALKKYDMDLDKAAPLPRSNMGREAYNTAQAKRDLYRSFTKAVTDTHRTGEPYIVKANQAMIDHYVQMNVKGAEEAYRAFMAKMIQKIGKPVVDAKMTGNIWTNAVLHVTTNDGEKQTWNTQMIINFSKYQKMFNQFPSRKVK